MATISQFLLHLLRSAGALQAKCTLNGEARMVHLMGQLNYAEVLDAVKEKFPGVGPFLIKYQDRYGLGLQ